MISNLYAEEQSRLKAENRIQELMSELQTSRMKLETISTPLMIQIDNTDTSKVNIPVASVPIDHSSILMDDQDKGMKLVTTLLRIHINKLQNKLSTVKVFAKLREKSLHTKVDDISSQYLQAKKLLFEQQEEFETLKDKYENQSLLLSHTNSDASISDNDVTSTDATKPLSQSHLVYSDKNLDLQPRKSRKQVSRSRNLIIVSFNIFIFHYSIVIISISYDIVNVPSIVNMVSIITIILFVYEWLKFLFSSWNKSSNYRIILLLDLVHCTVIDIPLVIS